VLLQEEGMSVRRRALNAGWYPRNADDVRKTLDDWSTNLSSVEGRAAIVPHAGWYFSGKLAFQTLGALKNDIDLMVVLGGHLAAEASLLVSEEDEFEVPGGTIKNDLALVNTIKKTFKASEDWDVDNGVEVQLPLIKYFWPDARIVSLRVPPSNLAFDLGALLYEWSLSAGETVGVAGSTDLTHYGPNYGFTPHGTGKEALEWVEKKNDAELIRLLINMEAEQAVAHAQTHRSACSIGAAAASLTFASLAGAKEAVMTGYLNSYRIQPGASFVGYAGIVYA
jgi:MEMO1 family protein